MYGKLVLFKTISRVGYTVPPIPAWIRRSCRRFDHVAPVFFRATIVHSRNVSFVCLCTIFALKKTGATRSKHRRDFRIHAGIGETVYPTFLSS